MRAVVINCTLKPAPERSNTEAPAGVVAEGLGKRGVEVETFRAVDHRILPGVATDMGGGDSRPAVHRTLPAAEILVMATPIRVGRPSSRAQRVIGRMDALDAEQGRDWAHRTGRAMAANLHAVAEALSARPVPAPPG